MDGSQKCPCFNDDGGLHASSSCECLLLLRTRFLQGGGRKKGRRKKEETSWHPLRDSNGERLSCAIKEGGQEPSEE